MADDGALRFEVLAALVEHDPVLSEQAAAWTRRDGEPFSAADGRLLDSATQDERDLAAAICGPAGDLAAADAAAIAALLRMAAGRPLRSALAIGLREAFLDDKPQDRSGVFAGAFGRLALPGLSGDAMEHARALLDRMVSQGGA